MKKNDVNDLIILISKSKFRNSFKLKEKDFLYIKKNGMEKIKEHAYIFVKNRLAKSVIENDGKQTPTKGHPVFIAQHATGTCCRNCMYKWHHIEKNKELTNNEINYIVYVIVFWINKQIKSNN